MTKYVVLFCAKPHGIGTECVGPFHSRAEAERALTALCTRQAPAAITWARIEEEEEER